jgi:hypothetical protein
VLSINLNIGNVVFENGWDIDLAAQFVSILFHCMYSCAIGCGSAILAVLTRWRGACAGGGFDCTGVVAILPLGKYPWRKHWEDISKYPQRWERDRTYIRRQVFPQLTSVQRLALKDLLMYGYSRSVAYDNELSADLCHDVVSC